MPWYIGMETVWKKAVFVKSNDGLRMFAFLVCIFSLHAVAFRPPPLVAGMETLLWDADVAPLSNLTGYDDDYADGHPPRTHLHPHVSPWPFSPTTKER